MREISATPTAAPLLDEFDAAIFLSLSPRTLQAWRRGGVGPDYCRVGGSIRYRQADLDAFVQNGKISPVSSAPPQFQNPEASE